MENTVLEDAKVINKQEGILDDPEISRLYTPIDVAKEEIWKRWNNKELKAEVEKFLDNDVPKVFQGKPKVALVRHISSPNREAVHFLKMVRQTNLEPLFIEYLSDKFVPENTDKYYFGKLFFYNGIGKHGGEKITTCKIIDIKNADGKIIRGINTLWGEKLSDFHHRMFEEVMPEKYNFFDISNWFLNHGGSAKHYYVKYIALFLCYGVLMEEFLAYNKKDRRFIEEIFAPAMQTLESLFGIKPLIAPLFHVNSLVDLGDDGEKWMQYPEFMKQLIPKSFL